MATPVRWTCSSTYQLIKEDFPAEWFPEEGTIIMTLWIRLKADKAEALFPAEWFPEEGRIITTLWIWLKAVRNLNWAD
jgi:hypothetical protein